VLDLAGGGELEAFLDAALRFQLGHFVSFAPAGATFMNRHGSPYRPGRSVCSQSLGSARL
jgi:hypothetical protein